jgi:hypothetical protein
VVFSRIGFPRKKYWCTVYVYDCLFVHGLFTLQLLDDNLILIIKINNTCILWLKGLKIFITDSPRLLEIDLISIKTTSCGLKYLNIYLTLFPNLTILILMNIESNYYIPDSYEQMY